MVRFLLKLYSLFGTEFSIARLLVSIARLLVSIARLLATINFSPPLIIRCRVGALNTKALRYWHPAIRLRSACKKRVASFYAPRFFSLMAFLSSPPSSQQRISLTGISTVDLIGHEFISLLQYVSCDLDWKINLKYLDFV